MIDAILTIAGCGLVVIDAGLIYWLWFDDDRPGSRMKMSDVPPEWDAPITPITMVEEITDESQ